MTDIIYPLQVKDGDIAISSDENVIGYSQASSYLNHFRDESFLEPTFGRVTQPQQYSNRSPSLQAELERLSMQRYFTNVQLKGRYFERKLLLNVQLPPVQ